MEPVNGGKLVNLPQDAKAELERLNEKACPQHLKIRELLEDVAQEFEK